jgi:hypothetical protein
LALVLSSCDSGGVVLTPWKVELRDILQAAAKLHSPVDALGGGDDVAR